MGDAVRTIVHGPCYLANLAHHPFGVWDSNHAERLMKVIHSDTNCQHPMGIDKSIV